MRLTPSGCLAGHCGCVDELKQRLALLEKKFVRGPAPRWEEVRGFFGERGWPLEEAKKFFLWYEGAGWCMKSGAPIMKWKARAMAWMMNRDGENE